MNSVFIESGDFDIGEGEEYQFINEIIPDIQFTGSGDNQTINVVLKKRNYPGESLTTSSTTNCTATTTKIQTRMRARQAVLRVESDDNGNTDVRTGVGFRIGATRMSLQPNGKR